MSLRTRIAEKLEDRHRRALVMANARGMARANAEVVREKDVTCYFRR